MHFQIITLLERRIERAVKEHGEHLRPQFRATIDRMHATSDSEEMAKLMEDATALLRQYEDTTSLRGGWNAIKAKFKPRSAL